MNIKKRCVAMLLAGGQGSRLYALTKKRAKPAVPFGAKYRIIDFPLSNCVNSGIDTVGVLTQYEPLELNSYIGTGAPWDLDCMNGGAFVLPPYVKGKTGEWYAGTANAVFQNINFINQYNPDYILVLSGDHIYKMDYDSMIRFHEKNDADATIAVIEVPMEEASRFGIMNTDEELKITEFEEKPKNPKNNLASMGVYVFDWRKLSKYLIEDSKDPNSENDFGKNIIPTMLGNGERLFAYRFDGYWRDVGTVDSLWEANMELLEEGSILTKDNSDFKIYTRNYSNPPHFVAKDGVVKQSIIADGCLIEGEVVNSVIHPGVRIGKGTKVINSIVMANTVIEADCIVSKTIIDEKCNVDEKTIIGGKESITVVGSGTIIRSGCFVKEGEMIDPDSVIEAKEGDVECQKKYLESFALEARATS